MILSSQNSKIRLFEVVNHKIQKEYTGIEPIEKIRDFAKLYAEVNIYDTYELNKFLSLNYPIYIYCTIIIGNTSG